MLAEFGFWAVMAALSTAFVWLLLQITSLLVDAWFGIVNSSDRKRLNEWLTKNGYGKDIGRTYCKREEDRDPDYAMCRAKEVTKFIRAFAAKSRECEFEDRRVVGHAGTAPIVQTSEMHYDFIWSKPKLWACAFVEDIPTPIGTMSFIDIHWTWDAGTYL